MIIPHEFGTQRLARFNALYRGIMGRVFNLFWMTQRYQTVGALHYHTDVIADRFFFSFKIERRERSSAFMLDRAGKGWVLRRNLDGFWQRMCWLPYKRRENGGIQACYGQRIVVCAGSGVLTILDFSNV
jgi:hypothetical protein